MPKKSSLTYKYNPALSVKEIAERCVKILLQCIEKKKPSIREQIDFTLVAGESTRKIK